jgi:hypothetical protein
MVTVANAVNTHAPARQHFWDFAQAPPKPLFQAAQQISTATALIQLGRRRSRSTFAQLQPTQSPEGSTYTFPSAHRLSAGAHRARTDTPPTRSHLIPCLHIHRHTSSDDSRGRAHTTHRRHPPCRSSPKMFTAPSQACCRASSRPTTCSAPPRSSS